MKHWFLRMSIGKQITTLVIAALFMLTAANFLVTFLGPPPKQAPSPIDLIADRLVSERAQPGPTRWQLEENASAFAAREGERRQPALEQLVAELTGQAVSRIRLASDDSPLDERAEKGRPSPTGSGRPGSTGPITPDPFENRRVMALALFGQWTAGLQHDDGSWRILRSRSQPLLTSWHRSTLAITLAIATILGLIAYAIVQGIVKPVRRLSNEASTAYVDGKRGPITISGPPEIANLATTIKDMRDRMADLLDNRTMMLAAIAHDMAAPLARLEFHAAKLPDAARIKAEADMQELSAMVSNIIDFAKGQPRPEKRCLDLTGIVRDMVIQQSRDDAPLKLRTHEPMPVTVDETTIRRLVGNLLANAQRYAGGADISLQKKGGGVALTVTDNGPGFPPEMAEKLFEPFFRVESSRNRATAGAGLGLANARAIAESHGGSLTARNRKQGGAEFALILPPADNRAA